MGSWVQEQAEQLAARTRDYPSDRPVVFEAGFGASGLVHLGSVSEILRLTMVRRAFERLTGRKTILYVVSDDYDALRKVPTNFTDEQQAALEPYIGVPVSMIPNIFGTHHSSYAAYINAGMTDYLAKLGLKNNRDYIFLSATDAYKTGRYNKTLNLVADHVHAIKGIVLPTLGRINEDRQNTWFPFLPIIDGRVHHDVRNAYVHPSVPGRHMRYMTFTDESGKKHVSHSILDGDCKLQWKTDWPARWVAIDVDYEMHGKDLIPSARLGEEICRALGREPPILMTYELFLDKDGHKVSKSKGNGFSLERWLKYAPAAVIWYFAYQNPTTAKKVHFDVVPQMVDAYLKDLQSCRLSAVEGMPEVISLIHPHAVPDANFDITFGVLLNLVEVANSRDPEVLWGFVNQHTTVPEGSRALMDDMIRGAINYYVDKIEPTKQFKTPNAQERTALLALAIQLATLDQGLDAEGIQFHIYEIGKAHYGKERLREFFQMIYEVLFGKTQGPRFGTFVSIYGIKDSVALIRGKVQ